jgi:hypothetical protein
MGTESTKLKTLDLFSVSPILLALALFMLALTARAFYLLPVPAFVAIIYGGALLIWCMWCAAAPIYYFVTMRKWRALSYVAAGIF